MIRRTTWVLVGVLVAAVAGTVWWSNRPPAVPSDQTPTPEPVWQVDSSTIQSIRIEDLEGGTIVEVERNAVEAWHLVQPTPGPADAGRVERGATWLALPQPHSILHDVQDLAAFGLDQPSKKIVVIFQDGSQQELAVGRTDPTGSVIYVQASGSTDVLLFNAFGLDEVLGLLDPIPTAPPTATPSPAVTATPVPPAATPGASPTS